MAASSRPDSGVPIPPPLRHQLEVQMRADLSGVRIHSDHTPTMIGAQALTTGSDIYFRPGVYNAHSPEGRELLGHELTHVVQQSGTRPATPPPR